MAPSDVVTVAARKKKDTSEEQPTGAPDVQQPALPNALKMPTKKGFTRATAVPADVEPATDPHEQRRGITTAGQIATGRGPTYEWEFFVSDVENRLRSAEIAIAGGGGGGGGGLGYVHTQTLPSASWAINHALATKPGVTVVDGTGQQIYADVHYPDDNNTVIVFGVPYAGTAYLRG